MKLGVMQHVSLLSDMLGTLKELRIDAAARTACGHVHYVTQTS